jgi:hypothetical protein
MTSWAPRAIDRRGQTNPGWTRVKRIITALKISHRIDIRPDAGYQGSMRASVRAQQALDSIELE